MPTAPKTQTTKINEIKRGWHFLNADGQVLGRLASEIAIFLMGKNKPYWTGYLDCGDYVVITNAAKVKVTGQKAKQKKFYHYSGYPGGLKEINFAKQLEKDPRKIIRHAVSGMLPGNKLKAKRLARLKIFADEEHPYKDKISNSAMQN